MEHYRLQGRPLKSLVLERFQISTKDIPGNIRQLFLEISWHIHSCLEYLEVLSAFLDMPEYFKHIVKIFKETRFGGSTDWYIMPLKKTIAYSLNHARTVLFQNVTK
ncbi:hypothetical protein RF11_12568 [Thelohanellus kitauei]|uniref:Uncharacterized protein n=1 Tax=Thelohanellus kitauei TaxID=669202 RepID=A0A0C2ME52_THEKT|nr:hypothetical protein RF11_12568 [Thelohanellus kitauei]